MSNDIKKTIFGALALTLMSAPVLAQDGDIEEIDFGAPEALKIVSDTSTHDFSVEIADTAEKQTRGLMYRDVIDPDKGMLFEYAEQGVLSIWMKNTAVPLDIIFIRKNGKILKIEHSATPYSLRSISSEATVAGVLELAGGRALELGIMPGDEVKHPFFGNVETEE